MAGGIDLLLAELISEWRLAHPDASLEEMIEFFSHFLSTHPYETRKFPKSFHNRPLTSYAIKERPARKSIEDKPTSYALSSLRSRKKARA